MGDFTQHSTNMANNTNLKESIQTGESTSEYFHICEKKTDQTSLQSSYLETEETEPFNDIEAISKLLDETVQLGRKNTDNGIITPETPLAQSSHPEKKETSYGQTIFNIRIHNIISHLLNTRGKLHESPCQFIASDQAANHNLKILKDNDFNLEKICQRGSRSVMTFGSEYKPVAELKKLFGKHPRWNKFHDILTFGVNFDLEYMDEDLRLKDLNAAYERGIHKSAKKNEHYLSKDMTKEIEQGWSLILPENCYKDIPGLILNHMGVATHLGITSTREFSFKNRVTHDLFSPENFQAFRSIQEYGRWDWNLACFLTYSLG